jgi:hypothetical protein
LSTVAPPLEREVAETVHRLRAQADVLRAFYGPQGPIPVHIQERIEDKRRAADALEGAFLEAQIER